MSRIQRIIFNETSLEHALSAVRGLHDMSTELIAADVFRQLSELATYKLTPATVWCGQGGLYQSKLDAIGNGEQRIESAILIDEPDLAGLAVDTVEVARLNASLKEMTTYRDNAAKKITCLRDELTDVQKERDTIRAQLTERDTLLRDCFISMLKGGYSKPLRERIRAALSASAEPDSDLCAEGAHEFVPFQSNCAKCSEPYQAAPAPKVTPAALLNEALANAGEKRALGRQV